MHSNSIRKGIFQEHPTKDIEIRVTYWGSRSVTIVPKDNLESDFDCICRISVSIS